MKFLIATATLCLLNLAAIAQEHISPENRRFLNPVFNEVTFTENIIFAEKYNPFGKKKEALRMRIFEPKGDTDALRPLFVLMPGGGWVANGDDWMNDVATEIAKAGYVVAIHKYRLSEGIGSPELYFDALAKSSSDQRDAIQYLIESAKTGNRFRIDPTKIFIGGHSAGAITSMHTAYLDADDSAQPGMITAFKNYKSLPAKKQQIKLKGVINLSGLVSDLSIINRKDIPLLNIHGDEDSVVTADRDDRVFGSMAIHEYAKTVGTPSRLFIIENARHNDIPGPNRCEECIPLMKRFMFNELTATNTP